MSSDLFEKNAYVILGVGHDIAGAPEILKAATEAKKVKRSKDQDINVASNELRRLEYRLAIDALTLAPRVPDNVLDAVIAGAGNDVPPPMAGDVQTMIVVPEIAVSFANFTMPPLEQRHDLAADTLQPEIDR